MDNSVFLSDRKNGLRPGVVACIINKKQEVFFGFNKKHNIWEMPQGEIREGENLQEALKREIGEELGEDFARSIFVPENPLFTTNQIVFPQASVRGKYLMAGEKKVPMAGKKYYFCFVVQTKATEPEKIEYSEFNWVSFEEGLKIIEGISQKGKRRILGEAFELLKANKLIK